MTGPRRPSHGDGGGIEIAQAGYPGDPASVEPDWAHLFVVTRGLVEGQHVPGVTGVAMTAGIACPAAPGEPEIIVPLAPERARQLISTMRNEGGESPSVRPIVRNACLAAGWRPRPAAGR